MKYIVQFFYGVFGSRSLAVLALLATGSASAAPQASRIAAELSGLPPDTSVRVIVQYREEATAERHARTLRRGGRLRHDLPLVRGGGLHRNGGSGGGARGRPRG